MRSVILALVAAGSIPGQMCVLEEHPTVEYWLEGSIGKASARMYLETGREDVAGVFYFASDWVPFLLRGRIDGASVAVTAFTEIDQAFGRLEGRITADG